MSADLHIHTTASDGRCTPQEILEQAAAAALDYIAITDHDTIDGLLELKNIPDKVQRPLLIEGIEFSTDLPLNEVHILGYFIDTEHPELNRQIRVIADDRLRRAGLMVDKLSKLGYRIDYNRVLEIANDATAVGRPHVAAALLEKGYFSSIEEVFDTVLEKNKPGYLPHYKLSPREVVELITLAGGIPVLAHPGLVGSDRVVLDVIKMGVKGLEIYHPKHSPADIAKYEKLAAEYRLLPTGGSDFHGIDGRFPEKLGDFTVPAALARRLEQSRHERR